MQREWFAERKNKPKIQSLSKLWWKAIQYNVNRGGFRSTKFSCTQHLLSKAIFICKVGMTLIASMVLRFHEGGTNFSKL